MAAHKSWEEMAREVIVQGRPGDVRSAALGWDALLKNLKEVKSRLESHVKELNTNWKGPAYESFKTHVEQITKQIGAIVEDAEKRDGIVTSLNNAATKLAGAQQELPIPYAAIGDIMEARNGTLSIPTGLFEAKLRAGFFKFPLVQWEAKLMDWIWDQEDEARTVYNRVNGEYKDQTHRTPDTATPQTPIMADPTAPNLTKPGGPGGLGKPPGMGGMPSMASLGAPDTSGLGDTSGLDTSGLDTSGSGLDPGEFGGTGLAGAGGLSSGGGFGSGGLGGGGLNTSGLGGGSGLGSPGGLGSGAIPGGGSLGKAVSPGFTPGMMGGGAAGGGRGGAGRGAAGRGAGGARAGAGAGGRGVAAMGPGGHGGAGGAEDERTTWLQEDDDVWGSDGTSPPGVLK